MQWSHDEIMSFQYRDVSQYKFVTKAKMLSQPWYIPYFYRPQICEGYVFTPVCQSFCSRGGGAMHAPPDARMCRVYNLAQKRSNAGGMHPIGMLFLLKLRNYPRVGGKFHV